MRAVRLATVAAGAVLALAASALAVAEAVAILPAPPAVDDTLVVVTGFTVTFVAGVLVWSTSWLGRDSDRETPTVETATAGRRFGSEFDRTVERPVGWPPDDVRDDVRERLRTVAAVTVARADGCSLETARERVRRGTWTDDAVAAAFLRPDDERGPVTAVRDRLLFRRDVRQTVDAIRRREEGVA
ncbi:DUF7269 family protein [Halomicrococcus gelatinilyticus]|uniref:DUF7269 family protein n=1 Tax=Halomicrococcus gelatinilyticus TaxID=1702103 RepID=UPI002E0EAF1F